MSSKHFISLLEMTQYTPEELELLMKNNLNLHKIVNKTIRDLTRVNTIKEYYNVLSKHLEITTKTK